MANWESLAHSSLRVSGGKMRSRKDWPVLMALVMVPWRAPVMPLTSSAMVRDFGGGEVKGWELL